MDTNYKGRKQGVRRRRNNSKEELVQIHVEHHVDFSHQNVYFSAINIE
jgi:hypothetical protein